MALVYLSIGSNKGDKVNYIHQAASLIANSENIMHDNTIIAPSKQTAEQLFKKLLPTFCVGSPANVESGIGAIAVYKYNLKNLPYTFIIIINDKTVITKPPINVTAHNGIDAKNPQSSIASIIDVGNTVSVEPDILDIVIILDTIPCVIVKIDVIKSNPYVTNILAIANLINSFNACSGFLTSVNEPQVFITPITKNNTNNANPIACIPP